MSFTVISELQHIGPLLSDLSLVDIVALDTETSGLDWITCKLYTIQLYLNNNTYVVDCIKFKKLQYLVQLLEVKTLVGHNIKFDTKVLLAKTGVLLHHVYDTMLAEVLCYQGIGKKFYSLAELVEKYNKVELDKEVRKSFYELGEITELTYEQLLYAAKDVQYLFPIMEAQKKMLEEQKQTRVLDLEMRLVPVVADMENTGVLMNVDKWRNLMIDAVTEAGRLEIELKNLIINRLDLSKYACLFDLYETLGIPVKTKREKEALKLVLTSEDVLIGVRRDLNLSSPKQLLTVMKLLGINVESTNEKVLKEYDGDDELIKLLLKHREYIKKSTSFGEAFLSKVHPVTGRIHSEFNQLMADTGRFSSSNPNMQQIVRDSEYRHCFIAKPGYVMITSDYSQQELRLAGYISKEQRFIDAYLHNQDLHTLTASLMFGIEVDQVTKEQRQVAKGYNFAVLYGSTEYGLAYNFQMDVKVARGLLEKYYEGYPRLAAFKKAMEDGIQERRYSSTPLGRKRFFEDRRMFTDNRDMTAYFSSMRRQGFNHLIQGAGADITKLALCIIHEKNPYGDGLRILMPVHDEIVCEVREDIAEEAQVFIVNCMKEAFQPFIGEIPAEVSSAIDYTWSK